MILERNRVRKKRNLKKGCLLKYNKNARTNNQKNITYLHCLK